MVEYHQYSELHEVIMQIENGELTPHEVDRLLISIYKQPKLFYSSSEAVHRFIEKSIEFASSEALLHLIWEKIGVTEFQIKLAAKLESSEMFESIIRDSYLPFSHNEILQLFQYAHFLSSEIVAKAIDNIQYYSMLMYIVGDLCKVFRHRLPEILLHIKNSSYKIELLDIIIAQQLIHPTEITKWRSIFRDDEYLYTPLITLFDNDELKAEYNNEIQHYQFQRVAILRHFILHVKDLSLLSEMKLILPRQYSGLIHKQKDKLTSS